MKIAFYKAAKKPGFAKLWSLGIALITGGLYSHCEIVLDDKYIMAPFNDTGIIVMQHDKGGSLCFSASEMDGGTRFKLIDLKDGKWDVVGMPDMDDRRVLNWCQEQQFLHYDWAGLRGFVFPWSKDDPKVLFCSEAVILCCQWQAELRKWPTGRAVIADRTSPNDLATLVGLR